MNILLSIIYAPLVFFSLKYFDIKIVAAIIFAISLIWFSLTFKKGYKEFLYPSIYLFVSLLAFFVEDFVVLKILPLLISSIITFIIFISYINKNSLILYFAKRFSKKAISSEEQEYIQRSTLFWSFIGFINIILHLGVFLNTNINFWIFYSSVGWYFIFILAGIIQFLHRKYVFLRQNHV